MTPHVLDDQEPRPGLRPMFSVSTDTSDPVNDNISSHTAEIHKEECHPSKSLGKSRHEKYRLNRLTSTGRYWGVGYRLGCCGYGWAGSQAILAKKA